MTPRYVADIAPTSAGVPCCFYLLTRTEEIQLEFIHDLVDRYGRTNAVARTVYSRQKGHDFHLARHDRDNAAHAGLRLPARSINPVS